MADAVHTRRAILRAIPSVTAAVSLPACAAAAIAAEEPHSRVHRLMAELEEALGAAFNGQMTAVVAPASVPSGLCGFFDTKAFNREWNAGCFASSSEASLRNSSPEARARHHMGEIEKALKEIAPGDYFTDLKLRNDAALAVVCRDCRDVLG